MKKLLKSKKALSPVVAAIILIAVTVSVSVAVAAWLGSTTTGFMGTDELTINSVVFQHGDAANGHIFLNVTNVGSTEFTVHYIKVNGETATSWSSENSNTIAPSGDEKFTIDQAVTEGAKYSISLFTYDGTMIGATVKTA
ncbi:MAG: hypothetical protein PVI43_04030 [Candidatus Bathyarchaeota archaeon]|jgi:flagellin-like protein